MGTGCQVQTINSCMEYGELVEGQGMQCTIQSNLVTRVEYRVGGRPGYAVYNTSANNQCCGQSCHVGNLPFEHRPLVHE